jgi:isoleucyl-tRNA synthetase
VRYTLRPNLPVLGPRLGSDVGKVRQALASADGSEIARRMRAGQPIEVAGVELAASDVLLSVEASEGWAAAEDGGYIALVDSRLTSELESEGMARELVRRLQDLRREAGLELSDRINVSYRGDDFVALALQTHGTAVAEETLADSISAGEPPAGSRVATANIDGHEVTLALGRAYA